VVTHTMQIDGDLAAQLGRLIGGAPPKPAWRCPVLREELKITPGAANADGSPTWVIHDPVVNRFFSIGWIEFELLCVWDLKDAASMAQSVSERTPLHCTVADVESLGRFLQDHCLVKVEAREDVDRLQKMKAARKASFWQTVLHHYLFFRVPLVKPLYWFAAIEPLLRVIPWRVVFSLIGLVSAVGVYLVSRQWDVFTHTLVDSFTLEGLLGYTIALLIAKLFHELGHGLVATYHGVRVGHMGVAFLVMFPMLYTDTGESWKLNNAKHRMQIASAGILTELALGGLCAFAWAISPDGALRNGLFFLATTSWVLTLLLNASPFMRFDGYFILSDLLRFPNLHQRSTALAQTWWRGQLLGWETRWHEVIAPRFRSVLIAFATLTWIYRFFMFLGIALLVYFFFFKVLGIFLMLVELHVFIFRPILRELKTWWAAKASIPMRNVIKLFLLFSLLIGFLAVPWRQSIKAYGVLKTESSQAIYSPFPAQVLQIQPNDTVKKGDVLFVLSSRQIEISAAKAQSQSDSKRRQLAGLVGLNDGENSRAVLQSELLRLQAEKDFSTGELQRLVIRAPFDGVVSDRNADVRAGGWVASSTSLAMMIAPNQWVVEAYVEEQEISRIEAGQTAEVMLMGYTPRKVDAKVLRVERSAAKTYASPLLETRYGGPLPVTTSARAADAGQGGVEIPKAFYRVVLSIQGEPDLPRMTYVQARIESTPQSFLGRLWRAAVALVIRELSF
jgi:putative peptide zinc metalloprotease protein